jgi:hypothetical protein
MNYRENVRLFGGRGFSHASNVLVLLVQLLNPDLTQALLHFRETGTSPASSVGKTMAPAPDISGEEFPCPGAEEVYSTASNPGSTYQWTLSGGGIIVAQNGASVNIDWSTAQGSGPHYLMVNETDLLGAIGSDQFVVYIQDIVLTCNDTVQVSLDVNGVATVEPDQILEGSYVTYMGFKVEIFTPFGQNLGNQVDCRHIGHALRVEVTGECDQNFCWGTIVVEDKAPPQIICPPDTLELECFDEVSLADFPGAIDNCDPDPDVNLILEEVDTNNVCNGRLIKRVFIATDEAGLSSAPCTQYIRILPPGKIQFPDDITWTCEQYRAFPNIVQPTALHHCIRDNAADLDKAPLYCRYAHGDDVPGVDPYHAATDYWLDAEDLDVPLDPNYDDNIDNPITDPVPNRYDPGTGLPVYSTFGTPSPETDPATDVCNLTLGLGICWDTLIDYTHHTPDTILVPRYRSGTAIRGLEDADVLSLTGSGTPNVNHKNCGYAVTYRDQKLEACSGVDTSVVFKILRTWIALDWCTGKIMTDIQVIKVVDKIAPSIEVDTFSLEANQRITGVHGQCFSTGLIHAPIVKDNCTPIADLRIFTPAGEAIYVNGKNGLAGGHAPAPGLPVGSNTIIYVASDACGNITEDTVEVEVVDRSVPVMVCREYTDISLGIDGRAVVEAWKFDENSYDNCCLDSFFVKRMGEADSLFRKEMLFTCADSVVIVILRAYDCFGNHNECMIQAQISDKLRPVCVPPKDVWISCEDLPDNFDPTDFAYLRSRFGEAIAIDNCQAQLIELTPDVQLDQCGAGRIVRRFQAIDRAGLKSSICTQTIMVRKRVEYEIKFPADWTGKCKDLVTAPKLIFTKGPCDIIGANFEDLRFDLTNDGACYKIIRTWYILDWCAYDGFSDPIAVPYNPRGVTINHLTHNAHGYYTYKQIIKVLDNEPPVLSYTGPVEFCGGLNPDCTGPVDIYPNIKEDCTSDVSVSWKLDLNNDGSVNDHGLNRFKRNLPVGKHRVVFEVRDGCGNYAFLEIRLVVKDCKKPTPVCINGLAADLMQDGTLSLWATDFENSSFDFCTPQQKLKFRINRTPDMDNDGLITFHDLIMTVPAYDTVQFRCKDVGLQHVQMWVGDEAGNWDFCVTFVDIQDNMQMCSGTGTRIGGNVQTEPGAGVQKVKMTLTGNNPVSSLTNDRGDYIFSGVPSGNDYTVVPTKDDDPLNGVTTFDLSLIAGHILSARRLDSPYKLIAADANRSGTITTLDIIEIRKLILRISNNFRNNTSWRFVDKNYVFPDPGNPFGQPFPEVVNFNNLSKDEIAANFVAIKIGDINGNARANSLQDVVVRSAPEPLKLNIEGRHFEAGDEVKVNFGIDAPAGLAGFQFTLDFDPAKLSFLELGESASLREENFGFALLNDGAITASWNKPEAIAPEQLTFMLTFRAVEAGNLSDAIRVSSRHTLAEAFSESGELFGVAMHFDDKPQVASTFGLYQNKPNPFRDATVIGFELPGAGTTTLTVCDLQGKVVAKREAYLGAGYHEFSLPKNELPGTGVYYYRLDSQAHTATRKMILIE